jgi:hypothetical protein
MFVWKDFIYVFGGQDLKEDTYGDLWRLPLAFLKEKQSLMDSVSLEDDVLEVPSIEWEVVEQKGTMPSKIAHHSGVLQEHCASYFVYGGMGSDDSCESLHILDLDTFTWKVVPKAQQICKEGGKHPGPREDFAFWVPTGEHSSKDGF